MKQERKRRRLAVVGAVLLATAVAAVALRTLAPTRASPDDMAACPVVSAPLQADADGDGCPSAVARFGNVLEVEGRRYQLGQPEDVVVLGDWDCDGRDTPALYRPGGAVFFFAGWADEGKPLPAVTRGEHLPSGEPEVRRGDDGCDRLVVR
jgi:hypothetical protein